MKDTKELPMKNRFSITLALIAILSIPVVCQLAGCSSGKSNMPTPPNPPAPELNFAKASIPCLVKSTGADSSFERDLSKECNVTTQIGQCAFYLKTFFDGPDAVKEPTLKGGAPEDIKFMGWTGATKTLSLSRDLTAAEELKLTPMIKKLLKPILGDFILKYSRGNPEAPVIERLYHIQKGSGSIVDMGGMVQSKNMTLKYLLTELSSSRDAGYDCAIPSGTTASGIYEKGDIKITTSKPISSSQTQCIVKSVKENDIIGIDSFTGKQIFNKVNVNGVDY